RYRCDHPLRRVGRRRRVDGNRRVWPYQGEVVSHFLGITSCTSEVDWFEDKSQWPKLTSLGMVESEGHVGDKITHETRYYISSLPSDAKIFARASRGHWGIENGLHWCLDIAFREDDSRIRMGHAANNLAIIRHFALNLIKHDKTRKIGVKGSRKRAGWSENYMLRLLGL
ncbi:MAG: ISAs1 family transposase, partial [Thermodesulfobacteriota bacterium]|nr:ISAs1 family transposase [Thermodesulfobacteriota bacterium]